MVPPPKPPALRPCKYGLECFRKNPDHLREFLHPTRPLRPKCAIPDSRLLCSHDGRLALVGDSSVQLFSYRGGLVTGLSKTCEVSPPGRVESITLWDCGLAIGTSTELALVRPHPDDGSPWAVSMTHPVAGGARAISGSGKTGAGSFVLVGGGAGSLSLVSVALGGVALTLPEHESGVWACDLSEDCSRTVSGTDRDELFVKVYDVRSKQLIREYDDPLGGDGIVRTLFTSHGNETVLVADCEGSAVGIFDLRQTSNDPAIRMPFPTPQGMAWHADMSPSGHHVIAGRGSDVLEWDTRSPGAPRSTITSPGSGAVQNVAYSQDLSCIFVTRSKKGNGGDGDDDDDDDDGDDDAPGKTQCYPGPNLEAVSRCHSVISGLPWRSFPDLSHPLGLRIAACMNDK
jgi:WD40 repeat protein